MLSQVTPRILGVLSRGMRPLQIVADGWYRDWCVSGVKSVTEDLPGATASFLSADQSEVRRRSMASSASAASSLGDDTKMVRSSAYEAMFGDRHWDIGDEVVKEGRRDDRARGTPASEVAAQPADQVVV